LAGEADRHDSVPVQQMVQDMSDAFCQLVRIVLHGGARGDGGNWYRELFEPVAVSRHDRTFGARGSLVDRGHQ
jgi:hypothetical protein